MEANQILKSHILDIVFEGKNKLYGAYELRKTYNGRLIKALASTALILVVLFVGTVLAGSSPSKKSLLSVGPEVKLTQIEEDLPKPPVEIIPPKPIEIPNQVRHLKPIVVKDDKVDPDEKIEEILDEQAISAHTIKTDFKSPVVQAPVDDPNARVVELPVINTEPEIFTSVEIDAAFPGGLAAWKKYLEKNLDPETAMTNGAAAGIYKVMIRFVVDVNGIISDVVSETNTGYGLDAEAVKIIRKGPKWEPAMQNGKKVKAYRRQSISFVVAD